MGIQNFSNLVFILSFLREGFYSLWTCNGLQIEFESTKRTFLPVLVEPFGIIIQELNYSHKIMQSYHFLSSVKSLLDKTPVTFSSDDFIATILKLGEQKILMSNQDKPSSKQSSPLQVLDFTFLWNFDLKQWGLLKFQYDHWAYNHFS